MYYLLNVFLLFLQIFSRVISLYKLYNQVYNCVIKLKSYKIKIITYNVKPVYGVSFANILL